MHRVGVLPFDVTEQDIAMLFITSKTRGRWIPPKGRAKKMKVMKMSAIAKHLKKQAFVGLF